jgi:mRNA-degrading endonuclease RelE of RelBE toxin-antitoxin system
VKTVIETPTFQKQADKIWSEDDRLTFISFISENSEQGDVISGTQGLRKIRWHTGRSGKRSGVRIIYFNQNEQDVIYLLAIYSKSKKENATYKELK